MRSPLPWSLKKLILEEEIDMKHISAIMGKLSDKEYIHKRAWRPMKSTSGEWIKPFEEYYEVITTWAPAMSKTGEITNTRVITKYEFIMESFGVNRD